MLNSLFTLLSKHFCACQNAFYIIEVFTFRQMATKEVCEISRKRIIGLCFKITIQPI